MHFWISIAKIYTFHFMKQTQSLKIVIKPCRRPAVYMSGLIRRHFRQKNLIWVCSVFFFYVKKRLPFALREKKWIPFRENAYLYVKKSSKVPVKNQLSTWKFLKIYIRENRTQYTWKKWKIPYVKTVNPYVKKIRKENCRIFQQRDTFAALSLQFCNFYLKSNAYVTEESSNFPVQGDDLYGQVWQVIFRWKS